MASEEQKSFAIVENHFNNVASNFICHTSLNTTAHLTRPFYAKLSYTKNANGFIILGIKTSQSLMQVYFDNITCRDHKKLVIDDDRLEKHTINSFIFKSSSFSNSIPPCVVIGYRSGLVAYADCNKGKLLGLFNVDDKSKTINKNQVISQLVMLPKPNGDEVLVIFEDSTALRYRLNTQSQNSLFVEKIKKFELKTNFNRLLNKFKHKTKTKNNLVFSSYLNEPEFSHFYAYNQEQLAPNPVAYYKFNHRTISDVVVKRHKSFTKTLLKDSYEQEITVVGFTSLDGYLVLFELNRMKPLLSYKASFGGINSMTFSENGDFIALSGQDDCITLLDLNTLSTMKCEGHKSFVSKAIFHTIPSAEEANKTKNATKNGEETKGNDYIRVIGGGMDSALSFWEFPQNVFGTKRRYVVEENQPIRLQADGKTQINSLKPLHMESTKDAIGWIELCDSMLIQCGYDGVVGTYAIDDYLPDKERKEETPATELLLSTMKMPAKKNSGAYPEEQRILQRKGTDEMEAQRYDQRYDQTQLRKQDSESGSKREQRKYSDMERQKYQAYPGEEPRTHSRKGTDEAEKYGYEQPQFKKQGSRPSYTGEEPRTHSRKGTEEMERQRYEQAQYRKQEYGKREERKYGEREDVDDEEYRPQFKKQESESGYKREQEEFSSLKDTASHSMENLEGQVNKFETKSPSRGFGQPKLGDSGSKSSQ